MIQFVEMNLALQSAVFLLFCGTIFMLVAICARIIIRIYLLVRFWDIFQYLPNKNPALHKLLYNSKIQPLLHTLANQLDNAFNEERNLLNNLSVGKFTTYAEARNDVHRAELKISRYRREFWSVHKIVRSAGYNLSKSYKDFL